jgi:hypothetical protein
MDGVGTIAHVIGAGYNSRTTLKPMRALVVSACTGARQAERVCAGELAQLPPRATRVLQPGLSHAAPSSGARR